MSVRLYDEAVVTKIKGWVKDENMRVLPPNETNRLFQMIANMQNDKPISLPLIAISRSNEIEIENTNKRPLTYDGMMLDATKEKSLQIEAIPIVLNYQIDIFCKDEEEADEYMRNFTFALINRPKVKVVLPYYQINYEHWSYMRMLSTVEDNSDIPIRQFGDQFTRWTIRFTIDDAYLFSLPYKDNVSIDGYGIEIKED